MADNLKQSSTSEVRKRRLSNLIITRSQSTIGEIPDDGAAERDIDNRTRGQVRVEQGDTGEVGRQG